MPFILTGVEPLPMKRRTWIVGCQSGEEVLKAHLARETTYLETLGISVQSEESHSGPVTFYCYKFECGPKADRLLNVCRHRMASALARAIVEEWEPSLLSRAVEINYDFLEPRERTDICKIAADIASDGRKTGSLFGVNNEGLPPGAGQPDREIVARINDYLEDAQLIMVEGFVTFRMKDYISGLDDVVQEAVDAYLIEREYREFVRLLRYFVDVQEPRAGTTHVYIKQGDSFEISDKEGNTMDDHYLSDLVADLADTEVTHEDLLVSVLITLAPEQIVLHCPPERMHEDAIRTVRDVFYRRVSICTGCRDCLNVCKESTHRDR